MAFTHNGSLENRIQAVEKELENVSAHVREDENARKHLLDVTHKATAMVEAPAETTWRVLFTPHVNTSIRAAIEMGLFEVLNDNEGPKTATESAKVLRGDKLLFILIVSPLAAMHFVIELGFKTHVAGPVCKALAVPGLLGASDSCTTTQLSLAPKPTSLSLTLASGIPKVPTASSNTLKRRICLGFHGSCNTWQNSLISSTC